MRLNAKGMEVFNKWHKIYCDELEKIRKETNNPNYEEGWCIIEDTDHVKTRDDVIGILIFGDDDNAIYHILECIDMGLFKPDENYYWNVELTCRQLIKRLIPYYDMAESEVNELKWVGEDDE